MCTLFPFYSVSTDDENNRKKKDSVSNVHSQQCALCWPNFVLCGLNEAGVKDQSLQSKDYNCFI